jgi:hypothetical protein
MINITNPKMIKKALNFLEVVYFDVMTVAFLKCVVTSYMCTKVTHIH